MSHRAVELELKQLEGETCWTGALGRPHLANLRRDLGFEPCGYGDDVVTAGRLVSCLRQHARPWYRGARKVTSPPPHHSDILPVVFQMYPEML